MKVKKTQLLAAAAQGHVPPEAAAKATLIAAAVIATGHPRAKTHWPLVVPGLPAGIKFFWFAHMATIIFFIPMKRFAYIPSCIWHQQGFDHTTSWL